MNNKIKHVLENLPQKPGVYFMKDNQGKIIYIGKAKNLKNRVSSYFNSTKKNLKTELLVNSIDSVEYVLASSEQDAFSLESNLIKENQPKYNILLKDDKLFPYIRIDKKEKFPLLSVVRRVKNDGALYFGPYVTGLKVTDLISIIKSVFKIRQCKINFSKGKVLKRKCLFGDMGKCLSPCTNSVTEEEYNKVIDEVIDFLNGKNVGVKKILTANMNECVQKEDFEGAIVYRDQIALVEKSDNYILSNLTKDENFDVFTIGEEESFICVNIVAVRNGKTVLDKNVSLDPVETTLEECLEDYILEYYNINTIPQEVLTNIALNPALDETIKNLYGKSTTIRVPVIGPKRKIVDVSVENIKEYLNKNLEVSKVREAMQLGALKELGDILNIKEPLSRIECYDISNISGTNSVGSMVVFIDGKPAKKEYRKFKIKTVVGANDYLSLEEVLNRRFKHIVDGDANFSRPNLIVIDGGPGQLHSAQKSLDKYKLDINIISIAKQEEEIYTTSSHMPLRLPERSNARKLVQRLRDEAHRFAITFHKHIREKDMFK